jgi:uncharacterized protein YbgA (DUF1722 family)
MFGYFKDHISAKEKQEVLGTLEEYRRGELSLTAPLTLIGHLAKTHNVEYLKQQRLFQPFPKGLALDV